jgi:TatD DNase family protein
VIDTHCHLDVPAFDADRDDVIARAAEHGVIGMLVPAIRPRTWDALRAFAARHRDAGVRWAIGVHPQIVDEIAPDELDLATLEQRLADGAGDAIAIGECGLDAGTGERELQEQIFRAHIRVARALGKPLIVHVLHAHDLAPRILREERATGGVLHSYSGGADLVPVYADLGMAFSLAGPITYANARRPVESARAIAAELLLAETDAPDQAPHAHRGGRSEPAFLADVITGLAVARAVMPEEIARLTTANARRIFATW